MGPSWLLYLLSLSLGYPAFNIQLERCRRISSWVIIMIKGANFHTAVNSLWFTARMRDSLYESGQERLYCSNKQTPPLEKLSSLKQVFVSSTGRWLTESQQGSSVYLSLSGSQADRVPIINDRAAELKERETGGSPNKSLWSDPQVKRDTRAHHALARRSHIIIPPRGQEIKCPPAMCLKEGAPPAGTHDVISVNLELIPP